MDLLGKGDWRASNDDALTAEMNKVENTVAAQAKRISIIDFK